MHRQPDLILLLYLSLSDQEAALFGKGGGGRSIHSIEQEESFVNRLYLL